MGLTERHWFEDEGPKLTAQQLEDIIYENKKAYDNGYAKGFRDALNLLKNQEARELTIDEWREWKANPKRNPICKLWKNDTSPMWVLNPNDVHEPALLMGELKLFTGKPTFEQCKEVKWE